MKIELTSKNHEAIHKVVTAAYKKVKHQESLQQTLATIYAEGVQQGWVMTSIYQINWLSRNSPQKIDDFAVSLSGDNN